MDENSINDKNIVSSSSPGNNGNNEMEDQNVIKFVSYLFFVLKFFDV